MAELGEGAVAIYPNLAPPLTLAGTHPHTLTPSAGFQQMVELERDEVVIHPGESIQTHCWYDTSARTESVGFGFSTKDEVRGPGATEAGVREGESRDDVWVQ